MLKILKYMKRRDWLYALCGLVFIVCGVWLDLRLPDYMREITTLVQTPGSEMGTVLRAGGSMLLCALGSLAATAVTGFFVARIAAGWLCVCGRPSTTKPWIFPWRRSAAFPPPA